MLKIIKDNYLLIDNDDIQGDLILYIDHKHQVHFRITLTFMRVFWLNI